MSDTINEYPVIDALCGIDAANPQISQYTDSFKKIRFMLGKNFDGYILMIITDIKGHVEIIKDDGENLIRETDTETGETSLLWNIGSEVTASHGVVVYQIVGYKSENGAVVSTWYSKEGRLLVTESIDTTSYSADLVGANPNLITQLIVECEQTREACEHKVDKVDGKGLSACDFTMDEKEKLSTVSAEAEKNVQSDWLDEDETSDSYIKNKPKVDMELDIGSDNAIANWIVASNFDAMRDAFNSTTREVETVKGDLDEVKQKSENLNDALVLHKENGDEDLIHLTDEEKSHVGKIEGIASDVNSLILEEIPYMWRFINNNVDRLDELTAPPITVVPTTLEVNKAYNFGITENITLSFPSNANDGDVIYVGFQSLGTLNLVVDTTNTYDFELIPEMNTGYEIYAKYMVIMGVGTWIVKYSEYAGV